jgi:hypothetical protein
LHFSPRSAGDGTAAHCGDTQQLGSRKARVLRRRPASVTFDELSNNMSNINNKSNKEAKVLENLASIDHCSAVPQYAMRVECEADSLVIRAVLARWVTTWREDQSPFIAPDGQTCWLPDKDIVFTLRPEAPSLSEVRWLIDAIIDCHVAAQSLSDAKSYTGERVPHDEMAAFTQRPGDDVVVQARDAVRDIRNYIAGQFDRFEEAADRFDAELGHDGPYVARLQRRYADMWRTHWARPEDRDNDALAAAAGAALARTSWRRSDSR